MVSGILAKINRETCKAEEGGFAVGDTVRVHAKVKEGDKERVQMFEGTVIGRKGGGRTESFTVRRVSHGVGVERVFPVHSPYVVKVDVVTRSRAGRAKLYYLRKITSRKARLREDRDKDSGGE